jgi:signal-transduction protein with cAMP-binding, CBS, and nucleotidyltransferase domain
LTEISRISEITRNTLSLETQSLELLRVFINKRFEQIVHLIHQSNGKVVLTGVGKSGIGAMKIADNISQLKASDLMTKNPICIDQNLLAFEALKMMQNKKINHLVITGKGNIYKGIVHVLNLIKEGLDG